MKLTLMVAAVALAFGASSVAWANPTNNGDEAGKGDLNQTATARSTQDNNSGAQANENSNSKSGTQTSNTGPAAMDHASATAIQLGDLSDFMNDKSTRLFYHCVP